MRELSKVLDKPSPATYKEMLCIIQFVLDTKDNALKIKPVIDGNEWKIVAYSDSNWATDLDTRISMARFAIYVCRVPVSWKPKAELLL